MKALILAAGKGTRLGALTLACPKPMIEVGGLPLLAHNIAWLRAQGITQIAINLHHMPDAITSYIGDGSRLGVDVVYSHEPDLLGTAGAARKLDWFLDERFVVLYGDGFTNVDLGRLVAAHEAGIARHAHASSSKADNAPALTMALFRVPNPTECGLVETNDAGDVMRFVEKPAPQDVFTDLANAGIYICEPQVLQLIPRDTVYDFGRQLLPEMLQRGDALFALPIAEDEYLIDIGTPPALARAQELANQLALGQQTTSVQDVRASRMPDMAATSN